MVKFKFLRVYFFIFLTLLFFIYISFITTLSRNINNVNSHYMNNAYLVSEQQPLNTVDNLIGAFLLLDNIVKGQGNLLVTLPSENSDKKVVSLRFALYNTLLILAFPFASFFVIAFVVFNLSVNYQKKKLNNLFLRMSIKAEKLAKIFGNTSDVDPSYSSLSRLNLSLKDLSKFASIYQEQSIQSAYCDKLTQLVNRHKFLEHISEQILKIADTDQKSGLLFIDLDGFKQVNDSFGHSFGDEVLIQVAERLQSVVRSQNLSFTKNKHDKDFNLARLGGDEFTIFIEDLHDSDCAIRVANHVLKELEKDFILGNKLVKISASIGIAVYPDSANSPEHLVQMADVAMYRAKSEGRGIYRIYSPQMGSKLRRYHYLLEEMRLAILSNNFFLSFQPIIHVDDCAISYFEALVRWEHPVEGPISPAEFIPIAEDSNQILLLGDWILLEACRQMAAWHNAGMRKTKISVNVSGIQLKHRAMYDLVMESLNKTGLPASSLMLEITESCFLDVSDDVISELERLRAAGVAIAIDDFGTGFSSLSVLATLPVDVLKIDRMFIKEANTNSKYRKILHTIIELSQKLDLKVVAEGIEEAVQLELLKSLGVLYIQGYLISRPESSVNVGTKVLKQGVNVLAATGSGTWEPSLPPYSN
jgi:diguanylate cyclase (GGDEF)-like protein